MPVNRLTIESATQTTAHQSAGVSVSSITGDYTIKCLVSAIAPPYGGARLAVEESPNGATWLPLVVWNFNFATLPAEGVLVSWRKFEAAGSDLAGTSGAELRVNLSEINGVAPSITYSVYVEY